MSSEGGSGYDPLGLYRRPPRHHGTAFPNWLAITHTAFLPGFFFFRIQLYALDRNRGEFVLRT